MRNKRTNGFTLIEMLTVVVIIGILAGLMGIGIHRIILNAKKRQAKAEASDLVKAWKMYWQTYQRWPSSIPMNSEVAMNNEVMRILQGIPDNPEDNVRGIPFMDKARRGDFRDPWDNIYYVRFNATLSQGTEYFETKVFMANKNRYTYEDR